MSHLTESARFQRKYLLRIALNYEAINADSKDKLSLGVSAGGIKKPSTGDLLTLPQTALAISELHIEANITYKKKTKSSSSPAKISIYNLSKDTLSQIKPESTIILQAGYASDKELPIVFAGQIVSIHTARKGADKITTILAGGAYTIQKNARVSQTFPKKVTYKEVIEFLVKYAADYGLPTGAFRTDPQETSKESKNSKDKLSKVLDDGYVVQGWLMNVLNDVCSSIGYRSYISVGKLYVEPKEFSKSLEVFTIESDQIIGDIQLKNDSSGKLSGSTTHKAGISLNMFADGRITLDKKIKIPSGEFEGVYDINKLVHKLGYEESDWFTDLDLVRIGSHGG